MTHIHREGSKRPAGRARVATLCAIAMGLALQWPATGMTQPKGAIASHANRPAPVPPKPIVRPEPLPPVMAQAKKGPLERTPPLTPRFNPPARGVPPPKKPPGKGGTEKPPVRPPPPVGPVPK